MTFTTFENLVKQHAPRVESVHAHGGKGNRVDVFFVGGSCVYSYVGAYVEILRKLGVKAVLRSEVARLENIISRLKNADSCGFDFESSSDDYEVNFYKNELATLTAGAVIVEG